MKSYLSIFATLILLATACQKKDDTIPVPPITADTTLLLKTFAVLDTTVGAPNDTLFKYTFFYDNLKRCTLFRGSDGTDSFSVYNSFSGSDTVVVKRRLYDHTSGDSSIEYIRYSAVHKRLVDSIKEYASAITTFFIDYQYTSNAGGKIIVKSNGSQFEYNNFATTLDANGNILNAKDSLFVFTGASYALTETANANIAYDTRINPFYKIVPAYLVNAQIESSPVHTFIPFQSLQKNNILSETKVLTPLTPGLDNFNNTFQYTYNAFNYPTTVKIRDVLNSRYYKGVYVY